MSDHRAQMLTTGSILSYIASWLVENTPVLQGLALLVSIIAGAASIAYHLIKMRRQSKE